MDGLYFLEGDTYIVKIHLYTTIDEIEYAYITKLTTSEGEFYKHDPELVLSSTIVSSLPPQSLHDIDPKYIYHFSSPSISYKLKASMFARANTSVYHTSSTGLGSGIYGLYLRDEDDIKKLRASSIQKVYKLKCERAFIVQDGPHGMSITSASGFTNRYVDDIIGEINNIKQIGYDEILEMMDGDLIDNLVNLWNIVFVRSLIKIRINRRLLMKILADYLFDYYTDTSIIDTQNGEILHEMPINYIMRHFKFDSLLAADTENNSWGRGCVHYDYSLAEVIEGGKSRINERL